MNVALAENGATCQSSSFNGEQTCEGAMDGIAEPGLGNEWASNGEGVGSWLLIVFDQVYEYVYILIIVHHMY